MVLHLKFRCGKPPNFRCQQCHKGFWRKGHHTQHEKICQADPPQHRCTFCKRGFYSEIQLLKHKQRCQAKPREAYKYHCTYCKKGFNLEWRYTRHEQICPQKANFDSPFRCAGCSKRFNYRKTYLDHQEKCTGLAWPGAPQEVAQLCHNKYRQEEKTPNYRCRECNRGFHRIDMLTQHEEKCSLKKGGDPPRVDPAAHGLDLPAENISEPQMIRSCKQCGKELYRSLLIRHEKRCLKGSLRCSNCSRGFIRHKVHEEHEASCQIKPNFRCHYCSRGFVVEQAFKQHTGLCDKKE